ncbi:IPT/TIG domain-containing protein [Kitasatospora sp. NBC_01300]|uniref:IPT/TIG domain-containing protein n=1 Tax=Kitasatospora sp. NBC_01300 TaxID=2903574 RepID=UPI002F914336|nr:IPT/TIG domain-containing protein [Kitasatospora sp. NBC_01300]
MSTLTNLVRAGLAAALTATAVVAGATASPAAPTDNPPATGPHVVLGQAGNYPSEQQRVGVFSLSWSSVGTEDLIGPTHFTVDLPPGVTTNGAMFYSMPPDYTFTESVSPDGRHLEAVLLGNRAPGRSDFMKITLIAAGTGPITGAITALVANADDQDPTGHLSTHVFGGDQPAPVLPAAPQVDTVSTTAGPGVGGTPVTLTGTGLTGAMVLIGGQPAPGNCTDTACTVTTPGGSGSADITVAGPSGTTSAPADFTYTGAAPPLPPVPSGISLTPNGKVPDGEQLIVLGRDLAGGTVAIDGDPAPHFSCGPQLCTATAPASSRPGPVDVTVTTAGGTSTPVPFTYSP